MELSFCFWLNTAHELVKFVFFVFLVPRGPNAQMGFVSKKNCKKQKTKQVNVYTYIISCVYVYVYTIQSAQHMTELDELM